VRPGVGIGPSRKTIYVELIPEIGMARAFSQFKPGRSNTFPSNIRELIRHGDIKKRGTPPFRFRPFKSGKEGRRNTKEQMLSIYERRNSAILLFFTPQIELLKRNHLLLLFDL
jgi:hypothetical protein